MNIKGSINRCWVWIKRFRHRRGYGVHSPFAFNLITRVFFENGFFQIYTAIEQQLKEQQTRKQRNDNRMLLRLVNDVQPHNIYMLNATDVNALDYICNGCQKAELATLEINQNKPIDFLYCDATKNNLTNVWQTYSPLANKNSVFVFKNIYLNKTARLHWKKITNDQRTILSFDLYDFGIVFFNTDYAKQNYIVNY